MEITKTIKYIGVNDHQLDMFESQFEVPNGMAYNSYVILDDKTAVMDTVETKFTHQWLQQLEEALDGTAPDYLIVQHMEPDHSANIAVFMEKYPKATIVASKKAFGMMKQFYGTDYADRQMIIVNGDTLSLGQHQLNFVATPMVHWPEVMMTYDATDKVFFSADGFGKFGALDVDEDWDCEARRYYFGIIGKYGQQVQNALKKVKTLDIEIICPLHGPILSEDLGHYIEKYEIWSSYEAETKGVFIAYTSVYGHTKEAVEQLEDMLKEKGVEVVASADLAREDMAEAIEDAFRHDRLILATTTYNMDIFPFMRTFIDGLKERDYKKRTIGLIENGSWAPTAGKVMKQLLDGCKELNFTENTVTIKSALNDDSKAQLAALADELAK